MAITTGTYLGHYKILSSIGTGGMGEVYLAEDLRLERRVAIKIFPAQLVKDAKRLQRFEQEARAVSALNHPNIITLHEIGQTEEAHFMVIEFVEGKTLRQRLSHSPIELIEILDIAIQTANALVAAHNAGIVHRDIKPDNIMLRPDGYVKVLDFGIAKLAERTWTSEPHLLDREETMVRTTVKTDPGVVLGSPHYMSPEQARGKPIDARTDIFSLGVMIYEMVSGGKPFEGETATDLISAILTREPPPLSTYMPEIPVRLETLVRKALAKRAGDRYQSMTEMVADLRRVKRRLEFDSGLDLSVPPEFLPAKRHEATATDAKETLQISVTQGIEGVQTELLEMQTDSGTTRAKTSWWIGVAAIALFALAAYLYLTSHRERAIQALAVLPFANVTGDTNAEYLSDGVTESLINNLSHTSDLKVMSRNSVFQYKDRPVDLAEIRDRLGVDAVLTGRISQRGDDLLISVELIDARDNSQIWGDQISRKRADLLSVQQEIANQVSQKLRLKLSGEEKRRMSEAGTGNLQAYELYLRGRFYWNKRTPEAMKRSLEYFLQAIEQDPKYALAYAGLADSYSLLGEYETIPVKESLPKAKEAARKAIELDDSLAEAHTSLAAVYEYEWNWAAAESEYRTAIEKNPNYGTAHHWYGIFLSSQGRHDEAEAEVKKALTLDPISLIINTGLGRVYCGARRYDEAIEQLQRTLDMEPNFGEANFQIALAYEGKRDGAKAAASFQRAVEIFQDPAMKGWVARAHAVTGNPTEARRTLAELNELAKRQTIAPYMVAIVYAALGERAPMYEWLERVYNDRSYYVVWLKVDPVFDPYRADAQFQNLLARIGLLQ